MNYLAHLHLGGQRPGQLLGSLYGDFVKGRLQGQFAPDIEGAIQLHRSIDVFTDRHPLVDVALSRFSLTRRRYAGIVLDVFFDHCLARDWTLYADRPLALFTSDVYRVLSSERQLPERLARIAPHMVANDWLGSYQEFEVLEQVLRGISRRLTRPEELAAAMQELRRLYEPLSEDFRLFYPQLQDFARNYPTP
ncbi:Acyl carrier protein phosphodiesterase [Pseudomonas fluorescens]|jgi:acyl carrier protein phosphodiesterase|uniref:Acyl carrier protein phosphodiesterase n=2 Tax=Pseudomonas TaxID=286 RepID=A0A5E6SIF2_PSEFL|nr:MULTISPECIES: ACP phosphodiesterase [Pseudomonas]OXR36896.1 ACP phosphodiesterase [Pseudomonas jessenii]QHF37880.1 ACP phosphodiesterase [Pseudomonas sp. S34]SEB87261.1 Acyl carrier protein phosphodiesterase [Pseudomonas jessenii]VVM51260.1 Acyl carrier protein phosphodiesterase [Pseudomonas fluorescens]VVM80626.1 Acyl carrier protein phosphodiesterase [Pseudomonas fluorescens]